MLGQAIEYAWLYGIIYGGLRLSLVMSIMSVLYWQVAPF